MQVSLVGGGGADIWRARFQVHILVVCCSHSILIALLVHGQLCNHMACSCADGCQRLILCCQRKAGEGAVGPLLSQARCVFCCAAYAWHAAEGVSSPRVSRPAPYRARAS
jgi:hypothetical protein